MALEERFTYKVVPKSPIRNIVKGKIIMKPTTLSLSKSEVLQCLKHGSVYRKFYLESSNNMERVTPSNLDRLHRSNHITEDDYKNNQSDMNDKTVSGLTNESSGTVKVQSEQCDEVQSIETVEVKKAEEEQLSTENELISADSEDGDDSEDDEKSNESTVVEDNNSRPARSKKKNRNKHRQNNNSETSTVPKTANEEN